MSITELAIKRPSLIVVIYSVLGVLGIYGYLQLNYELVPKMYVPVITVTTVYPGASPNVVETSVTKIIEDAVTGLEGLNTLRSSSLEGRSFIVMELEQSANVDLAIQEAQRKVNQSFMFLPREVRQPIISKISFDEIPVLQLSAKSNLPTKEFYQFIKDRVQPRFAKVEGVGQILLIGGEEREIKINIDRDKLKAFGLSINGVNMATKAANLEFPTGKFKDVDDQYDIRIAGKFKNLDEIKNIIVGRSKQGGDIRLNDIAEVTDGIKDIETINRLNGVPSIGVLIQKTSDANTVEVVKKLRKEMAELEKDYKDIDISFTVAMDGSVFIMASANAVKEDLLLAILLVALVMLLFLHSIRNSLIVMVAIPSSLVSTFFLMYMFSFTLNMMTLLAMSLVIGILVDDSIVVLENIYRHLELGDNQRDAALNGRNEIGFAALSITLVDVVVFLPLALIIGLIGNFLRQYSLVVVFSTLMSLGVSFTITPLLASRFTKLEHLSKKTIMGRFGLFFENFFAKITELYSNALKYSLKNGGKVLILVILVFCSLFYLIGGGFIGMEFVPNVDRGEIVVNIELDYGSSIEKTNQVTHQIEKIFSEMPEIERVLTKVGTNSEGMISSNLNYSAEFDLTMIDKSKRKASTDELGQYIKKRIFEIPGVKARINPIGMFGTANRTPIELVVSAPTHEDVNVAANQIKDIIEQIKGTSDVRLSSEEGKPEIRVELDRKKLSDFGLNINDVGQALRVALTGDDESKFREGITEFDIRTQLDINNRTKTDELMSLTFANNKGQQIELKQFASIFYTNGPNKLERENRTASVHIFSQVYGRPAGTVANEIKEKINKLKYNPGTTWAMSGEQKSMGESFISMLWAMIAGILFVYMIMVALYDSYLYPFVVLFSIPLAIVGAFWGLALGAKTISIYSILGLIMMIGLVAKNAILIVDRTNQMKEENGLSTFDALIEAGQTRLRPILMTTFSMIAGMSPIAFSGSSGSEAKSGLAIVIIGGLISSLLLTLVFVPVVYQRFDKWKTTISRLLNKRKLITQKVAINEV